MLQGMVLSVAGVVPVIESIKTLWGRYPHPPKVQDLWKPFLLIPAVLLLFTTQAQATPAGCTVVSEHCTVGKATRLVQGFEVTRDCWEKQVVYSCPNARPGGACTPLSNDPDCTQTGNECITRAPDGVCLTEVDSFQCSEQKSGAGISLEGIVGSTLDRDIDAPMQCGSNLYCPDGVCDDLTQSEASQDFGKAASWMGLMTQMGIEKDPDAVTLFRGDGQKCSKWPLGTKDCCVEDGWLLDIFGCSSSEKILGEKRAAKFTHYIGSYCSNDTWFGCITKKQTYCSFRSLFSRVLQEQARTQLGISWGNAENPICRSLSIEEIERLDFSTIDLSEIYGDMINNANAPSATDTNDKFKAKIDDYYRTNK